MNHPGNEADPTRPRTAGGAPALVALLCVSSCGTEAQTAPEPPGELAPAFAGFDSVNVTVALNGALVTIESNGLPNHTSPYWSPNHPLFVEPTATTRERMAPGYIDDFNGSYALTISATQELASSSRATGLGPIGIAVSGAMIYNDSEGPGRPLDWAIGSLDYVGAHTGPQSYHYHLEPVAWTDDDEKLVGVMADGFFLYGRRDPDGSHPADLDASGGHTGPTPHDPEGEYHYHIQNALYLDRYYILFPGDYQGTPSAIR